MCSSVLLIDFRMEDRKHLLKLLCETLKSLSCESNIKTTLVENAWADLTTEYISSL